MLSSFRSAAGGGLIVREVALDLAEGIFEPMQASHISGLSNDVPDALSRLEEPGAGHTIPPQVSLVPRWFPPARGDGYYRSLRPAVAPHGL